MCARVFGNAPSDRVIRAAGGDRLLPSWVALASDLEAREEIVNGRRLAEQRVRAAALESSGDGHGEARSDSFVAAMTRLPRAARAAIETSTGEPAKAKAKALREASAVADVVYTSKDTEKKDDI
jgi:hypothetical protein